MFSMSGEGVVGPWIPVWRMQVASTVEWSNERHS